MSEKRRDNKGRILRNGESQRTDGRYAFKYVPAQGGQRFVYSWKLEPTDSVPKGKRGGLSLREKERQILKDLEDDIKPDGGKITVLALVEKYVAQKNGVRHNTRANYGFVINILKKEPFGAKRIDRVKLSDAKAWLIKLQSDGRGYSSITSVRGVVRPAFQMAVDDDLIRKNPFQFQLSTVVVNDSVTREALTPEQEEKFLDFIREDRHFSRYYEGFYILFNTGMRISEFTGLTLADIDMKNRVIHVTHQLQRTRNMEYVIEPTKTGSGTRDIPMSDGVFLCFQKILSRRRPPKIEPMVDGHTGFLFYDKNGRPMVALHWVKYFHFSCLKYNRLHEIQLPKVTPHICRHTFCSKMANSGMNPKTLQRIMGHADISVTLNTYTHIGFDQAQAEFDKIYRDLENHTRASGE